MVRSRSASLGCLGGDDDNCIAYVTGVFVRRRKTARTGVPGDPPYQMFFRLNFTTPHLEHKSFKSPYATGGTLLL